MSPVDHVMRPPSELSKNSNSGGYVKGVDSLGGQCNFSKFG